MIVGPRPTPASPLYLQKVVTLADDLVPQLGTVNAGDVMRYTLIFTNLGSTTLHDVVASDTVPAGLSTTLPPASAARVGPPSITGSGSTISVVGQSVAITIPSIAPGEFVVASFGVQVIDPLINLDGRPLQETFVNQATTSADGVPPVPSDEDGDPSKATYSSLVDGGRDGDDGGDDDTDDRLNNYVESASGSLTVATATIGEEVTYRLTSRSWKASGATSTPTPIAWSIRATRWNGASRFATWAPRRRRPSSSRTSSRPTRCWCPGRW